MMVWVGTVLTVGLVRLVFYWRPDWMLKCTCITEALHKAEYVLLEVRSGLTCGYFCLFFLISRYGNLQWFSCRPLGDCRLTR